MYLYICFRYIIDYKLTLLKVKWFTNLTSVGNIGSAAIYVALDELIRTKEIKRAEKSSPCTRVCKLLIWKMGITNYNITTSK